MPDLRQPVRATVEWRAGQPIALYIDGTQYGFAPSVPRDAVALVLATAASSLRTLALRPLEDWTLVESQAGDSVDATAEFAWVKAELPAAWALADEVVASGPCAIRFPGGDGGAILYSP